MLLTTIVPTPGIVAVVPAGYVYVVPLTVNEICVTVNVLPSASESLVKTFPVAAVSSATVLVSLTVAGASLTALTVIFISPVSVPPLPSLTV